MENTRKFGVALGGGGSRAFIHLGVLKRLLEAGLVPDVVCGSSMGAVLGALYASDPRLEALPEIIRYFTASSLFGGLVRQNRGDGLHRRPGFFGRLARQFATASVATAVSFRLGLRRRNPVNNAIDHFFGDGRTFDSLRLPFGMNALNLTTGHCEDLTAGPLAPALKSGVAIGLIFAPHVHGEQQYADAAPICPVPAGLCRRLGAETVLAVDICAPLERPLECGSGFDVVRRILSMQSEILNEQETAGADRVLRIDASDVFWADFSHIDDLVERGWRAADAMIDDLAAAVRGDAGAAGRIRAGGGDGVKAVVAAHCGGD